MKRVLLVGVLLLASACPKASSYPDGAGLEGQLDREIQALRAEARDLEYQLENCHTPSGSDRMYTDLHQVYSGTEIEVERRAGATVVTIPGDHLFRPNSIEIREEATMTLDLLATAINIHEGHTVVVEGHTDDSAPAGELASYYRTNWEVSFARAMAVMGALTRSYGVAEGRVALAARGEHAPIATNDVSSGKARNRRIVVYIYPPGVRP